MDLSKEKKKNKLEPLLVGLATAAVLLLFVLFLKALMLPLLRLELRHDLAGAQELLRSRGLTGLISVALIEALQMVVVFIPAEFIQISCGLSYSFPVALLACDCGVCLGATIIFFLVRVLHFQSTAFAKRRQRIERLSSATHERNTVVFLYLLFFMPIIPFGAICYYGSSSRLPYRKYLLTVATGVIPSITVSNLMGEAGLAFLKNALPFWLLLCIIVLLAVLLFVLITLVIRRLYFSGADGTPDSMMYAFIFFLVRLWQGRRQKVEIRDALLASAEAPYILLANHESFPDFYYISQLPHPRNPSYLVNEYYCTRPILKPMAKHGGILSKKLFTKDVSTAVGLLRMLRKGFPVVVFPEGRLSPDGCSNPIVEPGGALYKKLGVDLVLVKLSGAYFAAPKWRKKTFRSTITVSVERVVKRDELKSMTAEELDALIARTLYNDASEEQETRYPQRGKAVGLDTLLYRCADCGALYTTQGAGNELACSACGSRHRLNERYRFEGEPATIHAYYEAIKRSEVPELDGLSLRAAVRTKIFGAGGGPVRWEDGECSLTEAGFAYRSDNTSFDIPLAQLPALAFSCGEEFELYHDGELHYFYPTEQKKQVARWALLVDLLNERSREKHE